uniref:Fibronectin type-III domain-containing protein n=1 Tax=Sphaeramia orbicularis TaxID=375764 RepID=A0A673AKQ4_9TELE
VVSVVDCTDRTAHVSWLPSPNAVSYSVEATSSGQTLSCSSSSSSNCTLENLVCGQTYEVVVMATDGTCETSASVPFSQDPVPCAPMNVTTSHSCGNNDIAVSWDTAAVPLNYSVTATLLSGSASPVQCNSDSSSCTLTGLQCGQFYNVSVKASSGSCCGPYSGLTAVIECGSNFLQVSWNTSLSATSYTAMVTDPDGVTMNCSSSDPACAFSSLQCATQYNISVTSEDNSCSSSPSQTVITTGLCPPASVSVSTDCENNTVSWSAVEGAEMFIATATAEDGHNHTCQSNYSTSCNFTDLHCGEIYSVTVVTVDRRWGCSSRPSSAVEVTTAPCLPENVVAEVNCSTNVMSVSWSELPVSDDYTAWAISEGHNASCNSTSNFCSIHDLQCGQVYDVVVTASTIHCEVIAENTTVEQNCSTNAITVQWDHSSSGQQYTVSASSASGVNATCDTTNSSCSFLDLSCGQHYTFTVTGHTNVCMSESTTMEKYTGTFLSCSVVSNSEVAPCPPSNVSAELNCVTHDGVVSWSPAAASVAYSVQAMSVNGHNSSCSSMGTSCNLEDLVCGQEYSVVVEPMHTGCSGPVSPTVMLLTGEVLPKHSILYLQSSKSVRIT